MSVVLKMIKSKEFTFEGVKHTHYVGGLRGSVINVSTFNFEPEDIEVDVKAKTIKIKTDCEVVVRPYTDVITQVTSNGLALLPTLGVAINMVR